MNRKPKATKPAEAPSLAAVEYYGIAGGSLDCRLAVARLLQFEQSPVKARILSYKNSHALLLADDVGDQQAIKTGFSSGYGGTGPRCFSQTLQLLLAQQCEIEEWDVSQAVLDRLDQSALTSADLKSIGSARPIRPNRWQDYFVEDRARWLEGASLWREFRPVRGGFRKADSRDIARLRNISNVPHVTNCDVCASLLIAADKFSCFAMPPGYAQRSEQ